MDENQDKINQLIEKMDFLLKRQETFAIEINEIKDELQKIKSSQIPAITKETPFIKPPVQKPSPQLPIPQKEPLKFSYPKPKTPFLNMDFEKFIGENLISKIGIAILVIGVGIGVKYSIDHQLVSPLTRIISGYFMGLALLGFAIWLKPKYEQLSAVLLSGSMAIMYFITFGAYSFYDLIPKLVAFPLMLLFTIFTVIAALNYNKQIIAIVGLVGAYGVPFLLSDGSGQVSVLFSYMTILNVGILAIAVKKYWKPVYYSAFGLTWLIYLVWYLNKFNVTEHFSMALIFVSIFFVVFYLTFLSYKLIQDEKFNKVDIVLLLLNSFVFFGLGYAILNNHLVAEKFLGLFTLVNAIIHFVVSFIIYRKKLADRNLFYLVAGLVLVFITIAVPVQLNGDWVTLIWVCEAALLFWIGRTKQVEVYERLSYPLMILALISIFQDWNNAYTDPNILDDKFTFSPIFNIHFLTSVIFIAAFSGINFFHVKYKKTLFQFPKESELYKIISILLPATLLVILYCSFFLEISRYFGGRYLASGIEIKENSDYSYFTYDYDIRDFRTIWLINYTLLFFSILSFVSIKKIQNSVFGMINIGLNILVLAVFLVLGLLILSDLRENYLSQTMSEFYLRGFYHLAIRYISLGFVLLMMVSLYFYSKVNYLKEDFKKIFELLPHITLLWILSSELIHWMDVFHSAQSHKLGLSILWGVYSLVLISLGIWKQQKTLRIAAMVLFGVTLFKLFIYDLSDLNTIAKTIVFVSLGILLLVISFLYNKYKSLIFDETKN